MKRRMQRRQNKIARFAYDFILVLMNVRSLLYSVEYRVEQLKLGHMFNIINVKALEYLRTNVENGSP